LRRKSSVDSGKLSPTRKNTAEHADPSGETGCGRLDGRCKKCQGANPQAAEKLGGKIGRGIIPGSEPFESVRASQAEEKLIGSAKK
jgi:hypothetical protein